VPFVRFARDKRGYEYVYLVEASTRHRHTPPRVLYWYRTPPGVRVGREPFDAEVRRTLEDRYRDITFDWNAIASARAPNPETETWRERRRAKRDARRPSPSSPSLPTAAAENSEELDQPSEQDGPDVARFAEQPEEGGPELAADASEQPQDEDVEVGGEGDDHADEDADGPKE